MHVLVPLCLYLPLIAAAFIIARVYVGLSWPVIGAHALAGALLWTITEYGLHRFVFHMEFSGKWGRRLHQIFHGIHHDYPNDPLRLVMPPSVSLPLGLLFFGLCWWIFGAQRVWPLMAGFGMGYLGYDMTHFAVHRFSFRNRFFRALKRNHMRHHFVDRERGFGVSSPLWDHVFGTNFAKTRTGRGRRHSAG